MANRPIAISETYHPDHDIGSIASNYVTTKIIAKVALAGGVIIFLIGLVLGLNFRDAAGGVLCYAIMAAPFCLVGAISSFEKKSDSYQRTILLQNETLFLRRPSEDLANQIRDCCWFIGMTRDDSSLGSRTLNKTAIVIVFPNDTCVCCGLDEVKFDQWQAALSESGCRRVLRQEGILGVTIGLLALVGLGLGGYLGWHAGDAVKQQFALNGHVLPLAIAAFGAWMCGVGPQLCIPGWLRFTPKEQFQYYFAAILFPTKIFLICLLGGIDVLSGLISLAVLIGIFLAILKLMYVKPACR